MLKQLSNYIGLEPQKITHKERIVSGVGACVGIFVVFFVSQYFLDDQGTLIILASMGSSAVLLFTVPHGNLSQPWPLLGGHLLSALVGVSSVQLIENQMLAASVAVGISVTVMYYARCIHPPGGATALGAVLGGPAIHELGYQFVLTPVLLNTILILIVAIAFNALFKWRRYPVYLHISQNNANTEIDVNEVSSKSIPPITHEGFVYALSQIDTFIDVDESDLIRIYELATQSQRSSLENLSIKLNSCYSNGEYGNDWSVRQVTKLTNDYIDYKTVAGAGRRKSGQDTLYNFTKWALYEVYLDEDNWRKS